MARRLKGQKWSVVAETDDPQASADDPWTRIKNKYLVLLTRFRKGMIIFVPLGFSEDQMRSPADFDSVYEYLLQCGVHALDIENESPLLRLAEIARLEEQPATT